MNEDVLTSKSSPHSIIYTHNTSISILLPFTSYLVTFTANDRQDNNMYHKRK